MSTRASNGPRRTDFAQGYTCAAAGSSPGTVVVVVDDVDELEDVDAPFMIVVVDESEPETVVEVDGDSTVVVEVGSNVVEGRTVAPGATVATGSVVVVSPAAERFVALLAQAANNRPQARVTATALVTSRRRFI